MYTAVETIAYITTYYENSVENDGPEARALQEVCRQCGIHCVIGVSERDHGSLYMAQWIISASGKLVTRRKLRPSSMERIVFGEGDVWLSTLAQACLQGLTPDAGFTSVITGLGYCGSFH